MWVAELIAPLIVNYLSFWPIYVSGEPWRFITSGFLHSTAKSFGLPIPFHLFFNMWCLISIGTLLEKYMGPKYFAALYGLCLLGGNVMYYAVAVISTNSALSKSSAGLSQSTLNLLQNHWTPAYGASGAIFGLFGALVIVFKNLNMPTSGILTTIAINLALSLYVSGIAWQAHIGGLITGVIIAYLWHNPQKFRGLLSGKKRSKGGSFTNRDTVIWVRNTTIITILIFAIMIFSLSLMLGDLLG
jgi:membrane associated rhomboid family serine protease